MNRKLPLKSLNEAKRVFRWIFKSLPVLKVAKHLRGKPSYNDCVIHLI